MLLVFKDTWYFQLYFLPFLASDSVSVNGVNNPPDYSCYPLSNCDGHYCYPVFALRHLTILPGFKKMGRNFPIPGF